MSKAVRRVIVAAILVVAVYPLSYAPVYRLCVGSDRTNLGVSRSATAVLNDGLYWPVTRVLIDRSPLEFLLLSWSGVWSVGGHHRIQSVQRKSPWPGFAFDIF